MMVRKKAMSDVLGALMVLAVVTGAAGLTAYYSFPIISTSHGNLQRGSLDLVRSSSESMSIAFASVVGSETYVIFYNYGTTAIDLGAAQFFIDGKQVSMCSGVTLQPESLATCTSSVVPAESCTSPRTSQASNRFVVITQNNGLYTALLCAPPPYKGF